MRPSAASPQGSPAAYDKQPGTTRSGSATAHLAASNKPTNFVFRTEDEMRQDDAGASSGHCDSTYGVQSFSSNTDSLKSSISKDEVDNADDISTRQTTLQPQHPDIMNHSSNPSAAPSPRLQDPSPGDSPRDSPRHSLPPTFPTSALSSHPLLPFHIHSAGPGTESAPISTPRTSSLRSLRLSDDDSVNGDETGSQAITSGGEEDDEDRPLPNTRYVDQDTSEHPQFVMPSITVPSRRPFTEKGKGIGKLKIMVVGPRGSGKSSLIRSIIRVCDDLVHVDSASIVSAGERPSDSPYPRGRSSKTTRPQGTVIETYASSRAVPPWLSDLSDGSSVRKRKASSEEILERNICFIETDEITAHIHLEELFWRNQSLASMSDSEVFGMLNGDGGINVDLVLYLLTDQSVSSHYLGMKRLAQLTNLIPVIAKSDTLSPEETRLLKQRVSENIESVEWKPFIFPSSMSDIDSETRYDPLWAVSSALGEDDENMDASLLMSSDYMQPLVPSELRELASQIFEPRNAALLRSTAARKFLRWRRELPRAELSTEVTSVSPDRSQEASTSRSASLSSSLLPVTSPYTFTAFPNTLVPEERLTVAHLGWWSAELGLRLQRERSQLQLIQRNERRKWLEDRLRECEVEDRGAMINVKTEPQPGSPTKENAKGTSPTAKPSSRDPLNLLAWDERLRSSGLLALKVIGGASIVGAFAVWVIRTFSQWRICGALDSGSFESVANTGSTVNRAASVGAGAGAGGWWWSAGTPTAEHATTAVTSPPAMASSSSSSLLGGGLASRETKGAAKEMFASAKSRADYLWDWYVAGWDGVGVWSESGSKVVVGAGESMAAR